MLYLLHGTDTARLRAKLHTLVEQLRARKPDAEYFRLESEEATPGRLAELTGGQGLFEKKYIVVLDRACEDAGARGVVRDAAEDMAASEHMFIVVEETLTSAAHKKLSSYASKVQAFEKKKQKTEFSVFALTDALGRRDKKKAWVLFREAVAENVELADVHGALFWQVKSIILAHTSQGANEAGMKPFPYKKALAFSQNYTYAEAQQLIRDLGNVLYESRKGGDLEVGLERILIGL